MILKKESYLPKDLLMEATRQKLILKRPSEEAVRLANDIYYTYLQEGSPYFRLSLQRLCQVYGESSEESVRARIEKLLEELNEPIAVEDFTYRGKKTDWQMVHFLNYGFCRENGKAYIDIEINEIYLEALSKLESEPYLDFK